MTATWAAERRPVIDPLQLFLVFLLGAGGTGGVVTLLVKGKIDRDQKLEEARTALALKQVDTETLKEQARDDRLRTEIDRYYQTVVERVGRLETKVESLEKDLRDALSREAALQVQLAREIARADSETARANAAVMAKVEQDARITHLEADLADTRRVVRILAVQLATARGGVDPDALLEELAGHNRRSGDSGG